MSLGNLLEKTGAYLPPDKIPLIERAYQFAAKAHEGQARLSGEPYIDHPLQAALTLADLQLDASAIAAALLHDVIEDCAVPVSDLEAQFGPEVARLVDGVTKLSRLTHQAIPSQASNVRKMLVAMAEDLRVVFIKLADRLHNMQTLDAQPPERRRAIAQETMEIYAPLAHRLGIWSIKWQLEDLAFRYLEPEKYREVADLIATTRGERERSLAQVVESLRQELKRSGVIAEVTSRAKNLFSTSHKMEKYSAQGKEFSHIYDLEAVRVLVDTVQDCYSALGVVHSVWHPLPNQFDDYIASPKDNMYQSLHTTVLGPQNKPLEIQIRTHEMHRVAEYGVAAHWRYKEGTQKDSRFEERMAWLRQLMEWQREMGGAEQFLESVKTDVFKNQVFVYTPKGEIKELPTGSTPLDFAYLIHTELGHRCIGAKVNGRLVALDHTLQNGDTVEVMAAKTERGPSRDWLNPDLGYITSSHSREKVGQWFRKRARADNIALGRDILEKELRRLGLSLAEQGRIAALFHYEELEDFLAALGCGDISPRQVATQLSPPEEKSPTPGVVSREPAPSTIQVLGVGDLLTRLAPCCHPIPGDEIIGYITRSRGVTVHRTDCSNVINEDEKERLIKVDWGQGQRWYPVSVRIEAWDKVGLLRDITTMVSAEGVNIEAVSNAGHEDRAVTVFLTLEISSIGQLARLLSRLESVPGVISATRGTEIKQV